MSLSFLAIVGDLVESSIKRQSHSKDSGSFLPGHGGILDRFDSSLLAVLLYQALLEYTMGQQQQ
jgi:phosphatidate cytidylyltransferase